MVSRPGHESLLHEFMQNTRDGPGPPLPGPPTRPCAGGSSLAAVPTVPAAPPVSPVTLFRLVRSILSIRPIPVVPLVLLASWAILALLALLALFIVPADVAGQGAEATLVGVYEGEVNDVVLAGQHAFLATGEGLVVVELSDLGSPEKVGEYRLEGGAATLALDGELAYLGAREGLWILDVSDPASPSLAGNVSLPGQPLGITVAHGLAYMTCGEQGLRVVNVSDPANPVEAGSLLLAGSARAVALVEGVAFVAWGEAGLYSVDVSDSGNPEPLDSLETAGEAMGLTVRGERLYLAVNNSGLHVVDIGNPGELGQAGFFTTLEGQAQSVVLAGDLGLVAVGTRGVQFIDLNAPAAGWTGSHDTPGIPLSIQVAQRHAFIADGPGGLRIIALNSLPVVTIFSITPSPASVGESVTFRGAGHDPDGTIASYRWTSSLAGELGGLGEFETGELVPGRHVITFRVCDNDGACSQEVAQSLRVGNAQPSASITRVSPDPANEDDTVLFTGLGQDQDGAIAEYRWHSSLQGNLSDRSSFTTDGLVPGIHTVTFQVRDEEGIWSEPSTHMLNVLARPLLSAGSVELIVDEEAVHSYHFRVGYTDPGGEADPAVRLTVSGLGYFVMVDPDEDGTYNAIIVDPAWGQRNYSFSAVSQRGALAKGDTGSHPFYINARPTAHIQSILPSPGVKGSNVTLSGSGFDADGSVAAYRWHSSMDGEIGTAAHLTLDGLSVGNHTLRFWVRDDAGAWSRAAVEELVIKEAGVVGPPGPGEPFLTAPQVVQIGVATSTLTLAGLALGYLAYGENFRYRYWALLAPLMVGHRTELSPSDPLANEIRGLIRGYLLAHQGCHYSLLKEELGLVNGTLAYHLQVLEREGLVSSESRGRMRYFYAIGKGLPVNGNRPKHRGLKFARWTGKGWSRGAPNGARNSPPPESHKKARPKRAAPVRVRDGPRPVSKERLLELVDETPGISQTELAEAFCVTSAAVKYHIDGLIASGQLRTQKNGLRSEYHRIEQDESSGSAE